MFAISEAGFCVGAEILVALREPGFDALPLRLIDAIETIGAIGPVAVSKEQTGSAEPGRQSGERTERQVAIITIGHEPG